MSLSISVFSERKGTEAACRRAFEKVGLPRISITSISDIVSMQASLGALIIISKACYLFFACNLARPKSYLHMRSVIILHGIRGPKTACLPIENASFDKHKFAMADRANLYYCSDR